MIVTGRKNEYNLCIVESKFSVTEFYFELNTAARPTVTAGVAERGAIFQISEVV
jgi:hypothetical protein